MIESKAGKFVHYFATHEQTNPTLIAMELLTNQNLNHWYQKLFGRTNVGGNKHKKSQVFVQNSEIDGFNLKTGRVVTAHGNVLTTVFCAWN